ncbi:hypothetical protein NBRC111894_3623 [Sporolactobacillus inulinus]|uniref:Uncharacterized protein n=1 Tax=Sporolactobacillus inulinus TaxID=2078 RepID=A0A4Y1ZGB4_9BACL|nr:hypothetical protein NBRC111894_3623 [Sporolactobacillus inulinus]
MAASMRTSLRSVKHQLNGITSDFLGGRSEDCEKASLCCV